MRNRSPTKIEREISAKADYLIDRRHQLTERALARIGQERFDAVLSKISEPSGGKKAKRSKAAKVSRSERAAEVRNRVLEHSRAGVPVNEIAAEMRLSRAYISQLRMSLGVAPKRKRPIADDRSNRRVSSYDAGDLA